MIKKIISVFLVTVLLLSTTVCYADEYERDFSIETNPDNPNEQHDSYYKDEDFWDGTLTPVTGATEQGREWYNFADYSSDIVTDGTVDISDILQACVNEYDNVFIPSGTYLCQKEIELHTNSGIKGEEGTLFLSEENSIFGARGTREDLEHNTEFISNILITDVSMRIITEISKRAFILMGDNCHSITVRNTKSENCGCVDFRSYFVVDSVSLYDEEYIKNLSHNILVSNCEADGGPNFFKRGISMHSVIVGVYLLAVTNFRIENVKLNSFSDGIMFIGGSPITPTKESNLARFDRFGKLSDGIITGCTVSNVSGGGIWGCSPYKLIISNNTVFNCNDTGIDFEGGAQCIVDGNTVYNSRTNFMILDHSVGHMVFRNNHSYFKDAEQRFHLYGGWLDVTKEYWGTSTGNHFYYCDCGGTYEPSASKQKIVFENNLFESDIISYFGAGHYAAPYMDTFIFRNNTCINTAFRSVFWVDCIPCNNDDSFYVGRINHFEVTDNIFEFNIPLTLLYPNMLYARVGDSGTPDNPALIIRNNKIIGNGADIGAPAMVIEHGVAEKDIYADISGNEVTGFAQPIEIINDNTDYKFRVSVTNNKADRISIIGDVDYYIAGNTYTDGTPMSTSDMLIDKAYLPTENNYKDKKSTVAAAFDSFSHLVIDGKEEYVYTTAPTNTLKNSSTGTDASFKVLWENRDDTVAFTVLLKVNKKTAYANGEKIVLEMEFGDGEINTLSTRLGTKLSATGSVFNSVDTVYVYNVVTDDDRLDYTYEYRIVFPKTEQIKKILASENPYIGFNIRIVEDGKASKSFGFACDSEAKTSSDLGKLYLSKDVLFKDISGTEKGDADGDGKITRADLALLISWVNGYTDGEEIGGGIVVGADMNEDGIVNEADVEMLAKYVEDNIIALYGDVNGDGKIKGNDSTTLLKYLAGWDVKINTENADCNGDGKIRGNDSTMLLKYLAGWDVKLGK